MRTTSRWVPGCAKSAAEFAALRGSVMPRVASLNRCMRLAHAPRPVRRAEVGHERDGARLAALLQALEGGRRCGQLEAQAVHARVDLEPDVEPLARRPPARACATGPRNAPWSPGPRRRWREARPARRSLRAAGSACRSGARAARARHRAPACRSHRPRPTPSPHARARAHTRSPSPPRRRASAPRCAWRPRSYAVERRARREPGWVSIPRRSRVVLEARVLAEEGQLAPCRSGRYAACR